MAYLRPGGRELTDRGLELAGLREDSRILDIGCGEGDTVAYLKESRGMHSEGIDMNLAHIASAKEQHPGIQVAFGDGEILDSYLSFTFDGILMESSLSLINMPDEALHEAWCVLKKGGKLIISDLYEKNPDKDQMRAVRIEADRQSKKPHEKGDCEDLGMKLVSFRYEGAFYEQPLIRQLEETGFHIIAFEDHSEELEDWLKQDAKAGRSGDTGAADTEQPGSAGAADTEQPGANTLASLSSYLKTQIGGRKRDIGYFQLVAAKPL